MTAHHYSCRVRFSDVDVYGHVNNVKYFEYYQEARLELLHSIVGDEGLDDFLVVVAQMNVDYRRPIMFRTEPYVVESRVTRVGNSSFAVASDIKDGDTVLSRAESVLVTYDRGTDRARPLTDDERKQLQALAE